MPIGHGEQYDFFLSRRGSVAAIALEVGDVLTEKGYKVLVQDYDIPLGASFIDAMHEAVKNSRDLVILFTRDYEQSPYTRKEFTSFEADRAQSAEERHVVVLRCEDVPLRGLLADTVYQDLVGITDPEERKRRIIAAAERQSQAVPPPPRPFIGVPPRIASFTGRAEQLDRLDAILMQDKPAAVTQAVGRAAVQGMGGVGKTSLAIEYAHRYRKLYAGVCWCPAETRTGLLSALAALAVTLGAAAVDEADVKKSAKAALGRLAEQRATWLLIYDNVSSPDEVADLLPSAGPRVLITSRFSDWTGLADEVALDVLPLQEAIAFLKRRSGRSDAQGATTLAEALGYLPLALDHAAAYCKRSLMRFADYSAKASSLIATLPRGAGYPRSVAATFDLAITEAVTQSGGAEALMAYLAHCAPERIPTTLVEGAIDDEEERLQALAALIEVSLVKYDPFEDGTPAVTVHRLVQAVARTRAKHDMAHDVVQRLATRLASQYPDDGYDNLESWSLCAQLTPHLLASRKAIDPEGSSNMPSWANLLNRAANYFYGRASYLQATPLLCDALAIREKVLGPEHPDTASSLINFSGLLQQRGDFAGSKPLLERALAIREKVLGPEHSMTASSLDNLASLFRYLSDFERARPLFERALAIREKVLGPEHPDTGKSLNDLAILLQDQGDLAGARALFERALAIREKALGPKHRNTAESQNNLAMLLEDQGDLVGARALFERALAIREKMFGPEHPDVAISLNSLAHLFQHQGDFAGARTLFERALAIREKVFGPEHPSTATSLNNLACLLRDQSDFAEARPLFERALSILEKGLGSEHPHTAHCLNNLAGLLQAQGDLVGAQRLYERSLTIHEKVLGPDHPDTASDMNRLAQVLRDTGYADDAEPLFRRAIAIAEKALGREHPLTQRHTSHYARLLLETGRTAEALTIAQSALAVHEATSTRNHPWTKDSARVTADALDALGRTEEAKALRERYGLGAPDKPKTS